MTPLVFVGVSLAGGLGAAVRLLADGVVRARLGGRLPWGTLVINASGSLLLGFLTGLAQAGQLPGLWELVLGGGLLGGYTTFSTASFETVRLLQERRITAAAMNGLGMLLLSVALAFGAYELGVAL
jgi:CrcB protein